VASRADYGLPANWDVVDGWIKYSGPVPVVPDVKIHEVKKKCPEIPVLEDYRADPGDKFWEKFPTCPLPDIAMSRIVTGALNAKIVENSSAMLSSEIARGGRVIDNLRNGASSFQKGPLPSCYVENTASTYKNGESVTDVVASWVKAGFAAGPFSVPPVSGFRVNSLAAIPQGEKVRPVLNVSLPKNLSFNSNVKDEALEKVFMCSAKCFSHSIMDCGKQAWMAKLDMKDAYKNVPCKVSDLRLQGFVWLNKFFTETRQIFGARTSVCNFDILGAVILVLAVIQCSIQRHLVHRQLDDVPIVVPFKKKHWCTEFTAKYRAICKDVGIQLAEDCPQFDKAFSCSQYGKVLGIWFDTKNLEWKLPEEKRDKTLRNIVDALSDRGQSLKDMQVLMGRLNDVSMMCPFLKTFKGELNSALAKAHQEPDRRTHLGIQAKRDLYVWLGFLLDPKEWRPICPRTCMPPLAVLTFSSDSAGFNEYTKRGAKIGCGSVGTDAGGEIVFATQLFWPESLREIEEMGSRTTTLELIGLLLPLLMVPKLVRGKHIVLKVDNTGCYFAWHNKTVAGEKKASILTRGLILMSAFLECYIHVEHLPRVSAWDAILCDRLSRERTTSSNDRKLLSSFGNLQAPRVLTAWLENPTEDWNLAYRMLDHVIRMVNK
jgi:hypothetical protein